MLFQQWLSGKQNKARTNHENCHHVKLTNWAISPSLEQGGLGPTNYWTQQPWPTLGWLADQGSLTRKCQDDS